MLLAEFYKTNKRTNTLPSSNYNWNLHSTKYTAKQIGEMPSWIVQMKENFEQPLTQSKEIYKNSFSEMQRLVFNMVTKHSENTEEPLLLIINGEAGTGKSYLINALRNHLQHRCIVTATTGKASHQIRGITIHSYLRLPIGPNSQRELNGQTLIDMQKKTFKS